MKTETVKQIIVTIQMNEDEARWLKAMCQNSLLSKESNEDAEIRAKFWHAITNAGIN